MSAAANRSSVSLPAEWAQLERTARETATVLGRWIERARAAEAEVASLRSSLEALADDRPVPDDLETELRRLRAENAALQSRIAQAHKRVTGLVQRLSALEIDS